MRSQHAHWLALIIAAAATGCSTSVQKYVPEPRQPVRQHDPIRNRIAVDAPRLLSVGDSARVKAIRWRCSGDLCNGLAVISVTPLGWTVDRPDIATISAEGRVAAMHPGRVRVAVTINDTSVYRDIEILPHVSELVWEPDTVRVFVGDTVRARATARDSTGSIVAIVPASSMRTVLGVAPVGFLDWGGHNGTMLVPIGPGVVTLRAQIGNRTADVNIYIAPAPHYLLRRWFRSKSPPRRYPRPRLSRKHRSSV